MKPTTSQTFEQATKKHTDKLAELVIRKHHDYGTDNILKCPVGAELGIAVRIYDKLARLANLIQSGKLPSNESLLDTADDIMGYGLTLKMVITGDFTLPLDEKSKKTIKTP